MNINQIYNMDCVEGMKQMEDKSVDLSFTSPPYNRRRNDKYKHYNDDNNDYYKLLIDSTDEMLRVTRGYTIVNIQQNMYNKKELFEYLGHYADLINGVYIWEKTNPTPSMNYNKETNDYSITNAFEYFIFIKDGKTFRANDKVKNIITTSVNNERFEGHGAVMKMSVCNHFIEQFSKEGDVILDPFSGMATTAISARHNKRKYIGFELSKDFHEASLRRIEEEFMQADIFDYI